MNINFDVAAGAVSTGQASFGQDELEGLQKALTAGYGTDVSQLTGGSALRIQSLDKTMKAVIAQNEHFKLFNQLAKNAATATVDEWTEQNDIGGFAGGTTNTEVGVIQQSQGSYARRVGQVKFLMTRCEVSVVLNIGNNLANAKATEASNGALRLLRDAEHLSFYGDSAVVPTEYDGIFAQLQAGVTSGDIDPDNIIDLDGSTLSDIGPINKGAAQVSGIDNFGAATHLYTSQLVQSDFDTSLDPAFRVALGDVGRGGLELGAPVKGIRTSWGDIANVPDVFVRDEMQLIPWQANAKLAALATANTTLKPTLSVALASSVTSRFTALRAGNYYYLVVGLNASGQSDGVISSQQAITAGYKATLTITASAGGQETGYAVYRSRQNGSNAPADFRLIKRIPKAGATTTFVDDNLDIPGSTQAALLNMRPGADAIAWRQYMPMAEFQLYPTNSLVIPWAQALFGYLRIAKRRQHAFYKNIVPAGAKWRPFVTGA